MGLIGTIVKVAVGTSVAKKAIEVASEKISSEDFKKSVKSIEDKFQKVKCSNCGCLIAGDAKFCPNCGTAFSFNASENDEYEGESFEYEEAEEIENDTSVNIGYVREKNQEDSFSGQKNNGKLDLKCPHCSAIIDAFTLKCSYCGYELHDENSNHSVKDLTDKIAKIDSRKFVWHEKKKSALEGVVGMILNKDEDEAAEKAIAFQRFERQKISEKKSLILNYPVPNSREQIMEFMLLAFSSINVKDGEIDEIEEVWVSKMEQTYQRAVLVLGDSPHFATISNMYNQKMAEINGFKANESNKKKMKTILAVVLIAVGAILFVFGFIGGSFSTIALVGEFMFIGGICVFLLSGDTKNEKS